jgi:hypothetical protein
MIKTHIYFSAFVYLIFMGLVGTGLYFTDSKNETTYLMLLGVLCFFGLMLIYSLMVWHVKLEGTSIILKRFFGLQRVQLFPGEIQSATGYVNWDPDRYTETGQILELTTLKGIFRFDSNYYKDFDVLLETLFNERKDLIQDYNRTLVRDRKSSKKYTAIYFAVVIGILLFMFLKK